MAERPSEKQNWYGRFVESYGPTFRIDIGNPQMGYGGEDVYRMYGITKDNKKASIGLDQSGKLKINSDVSIEMVAGEMAGNKGEDILIHSRRGNVTITADRNGTIRIMGSNIAIESTGDLDIKAANELNVDAHKLNLNVNGADAQGMSGNMIPFEKQFITRVFKGITVGGIGLDIIATALGLLSR